MSENEGRSPSRRASFFLWYPRRVTRIVALLTFGMVPTACSFKYSPCAEGGDVTWDPPIVGNMECHQRRGFVRNDVNLDPDRERLARVNIGRFRQWYASGKLALDGAFVEGKRDGTWTFYDENGIPKRERTYIHGVERTVARSDSDSSAAESAREVRSTAPDLHSPRDHGPSMPVAPLPPSPSVPPVQSAPNPE